MSGDGIIIALHLDEAIAYGYQPAAVLQQTRWVIKYEHQRGIGDGETFTGSSDDLAALTGLSSDQVRRAMAKLIEARAMDRERQVGPHGEGKPKYRPTGLDPSVSAGGGSAMPRGGDSATPRGGDSATPTSLENGEGENPPPTPSPEGDEAGQGSLIDEKPDPGRHRKTRAEHAKAASLTDVAFDPWWEDWPSGKGRGARASTLQAWTKRIKAKVDRNGVPISIGELRTRLDHYRAARVLYHEHWKARGVEAHAPMMNGSTFVNSKSVLWAEPWTVEDMIGYPWPPPRGYSWQEEAGGPVIGMSAFEALEAEIAEGVA